MASAPHNSISPVAGVSVVVVAAGIGGLLATAASTAFGFPTDAMLPCGVICLLGAVLVVVFFAKAADERPIIEAIVPAMILRATITMIGAAVLLAMDFAAREAIAGWLSYWYMLLLSVEITWLARQLSDGDQAAKDAQSC